MNDVVDKATRSRMMSGIKGKNTRPEKYVRSLLHAAGHRFRLHRKDLPGTPDIILSKHRAALFVNGCFWHGHDCHLFRWPATRAAFWHGKISRNIARDLKNEASLASMGWRIGIVWECALKGALRLPSDVLSCQLTEFLKGQERTAWIAAVNGDVDRRVRSNSDPQAVLRQNPTAP